MAGIGSKRSYFVHQGQLAGLLINDKCADTPACPAFVARNFIHCIKEPAVWMDNKKPWIGSFRRQAQRGLLGRFCIKGGSINTFRLPLSVSSAINNIFYVGGGPF